MNSGLSGSTIEKINAVFSRHPEVENVIIYGSRAMGTYRSNSDIDLALVGDKLNLAIQHNIENELDDLLIPYKLDVCIYDQITNDDLLDHIKRAGKPFFTKGKDA